MNSSNNTTNKKTNTSKKDKVEKVKPKEKLSKTKKEDKNSKKEKEVKPPKKINANNKVKMTSVNVPVMRCNSQLKKLLNGETELKLENLKKTHVDTLNEIKDKSKKLKELDSVIKEAENKFKQELKEKGITETNQIKEAVSNNVNIKKLKEGYVKEKEKFMNWKKTDEIKNINTEYEQLNKDVFRTSSKASKITSIILEKIIKDILQHGIDDIVTTKKEGKPQKLNIENFKNISQDNIDSYPLIMSLKTVDKIRNYIPPEKNNGKKIKESESSDDIKKSKDEEIDNDDDHPEDTKKNGSSDYNMVVYNMFKSLSPPLDGTKRKLSFAVACKTDISDICIQFIEKLSLFLRELVKGVAQASTISEDHIFASCKLMFINSYISTDEYDNFKKEIETNYLQKYSTKKLSTTS